MKRLFKSVIFSLFFSISRNFDVGTRERVPTQRRENSFSFFFLKIKDKHGTHFGPYRVCPCPCVVYSYANESASLYSIEKTTHTRVGIHAEKPFVTKEWGKKIQLLEMFAKNTKCPSSTIDGRKSVFYFFPLNKKIKKARAE